MGTLWNSLRHQRYQISSCRQHKHSRLNTYRPTTAFLSINTLTPQTSTKAADPVKFLQLSLLFRSGRNSVENSCIWIVIEIPTKSNDLLPMRHPTTRKLSQEFVHNFSSHQQNSCTCPIRNGKYSFKKNSCIHIVFRISIQNPISCTAHPSKIHQRCLVILKGKDIIASAELTNDTADSSTTAWTTPQITVLRHGSSDKMQ